MLMLIVQVIVRIKKAMIFIKKFLIKVLVIEK